MPTIEERAQALADSLATTVTTIAYGDSFEMDQDRASAMILAFAQSVRDEALAEIALAEIALAEINDVGVLVPKGLTERETRMFCAGVAGARARFVALIDAPPSAPPADVTRALARLERANDAICAVRTQQIYDLMLASGQQNLLLELDFARAEARAALSIAEGE